MRSVSSYARSSLPVIISFVLIALAHAATTCPGTPQNHSAPTTHVCANECCTHSFYSDGGPTVAGYGCKLDSGACCAPGAREAPSSTLQNCLVIGDSVSEGYVGHVASILKDSCKVQHGPWCGGGSAGNVAGAVRARLVLVYGRACSARMYVRACMFVYACMRVRVYARTCMHFQLPCVKSWLTTAMNVKV